MDPDLQAGALLGGRYRVGKLLGEGGMGAVYEASDPEGRPIAIKVIRGAGLADPQKLARFRREAQAASMLGHPNIVQTLDFQMNPGEPAFLVMERLNGASLGSIIDQNGALPADRVLAITMQVLSALAAAHAAGIVHRDIKPDNVFLAAVPGQPGVAKLLDFGIAMLVDRHTQLTVAGDVIGSPAYMSPEQARGLTVDGRTDIYSLGACMFHALTGWLPGQSQETAATSEGQQPPAVALASARPDLPAGLTQIVGRAMSENAAERFGSAEEMGAALAPMVAALARTGAFAGVNATSTSTSISTSTSTSISTSTSTSTSTPTSTSAPTWTSNAIGVMPTVAAAGFEPIRYSSVPSSGRALVGAAPFRRGAPRRPGSSSEPGSSCSSVGERSPPSSCGGRPRTVPSRHRVLS